MNEKKRKRVLLFLLIGIVLVFGFIAFDFFRGFTGMAIEGIEVNEGIRAYYYADSTGLVFKANGDNYREFSGDINKLRGANEISVSVDVKPLGGGETDIFLAQHQKGRGYFLSLSPQGNLVVGLKTSVGGAKWYSCSGVASNFKSGDFNHVTLKWKSDLNKLVGFVNGEKVCQNVEVPGPLSSEGVLPLLSKNHLYIGGSFFGSPLNAKYFKGEIKDIRIYDRALTNDEIIKISRGIETGDKLFCDENNDCPPDRICIYGECVLKDLSSFKKNPPCGSYGDLDNDGDIEIIDYNIIKTFIGQSVGNDVRYELADVNDNGIVDENDLLQIENYLRGIIPTFSVCEKKAFPRECVTPIVGESHVILNLNDKVCVKTETSLGYKYATMKLIEEIGRNSNEPFMRLFEFECVDSYGEEKCDVGAKITYAFRHFSQEYYPFDIDSDGNPEMYFKLTEIGSGGNSKMYFKLTEIGSSGGDLKDGNSDNSEGEYEVDWDKVCGVESRVGGEIITEYVSAREMYQDTISGQGKTFDVSCPTWIMKDGKCYWYIVGKSPLPSEPAFIDETKCQRCTDECKDTGVGYQVCGGVELAYNPLGDDGIEGTEDDELCCSFDSDGDSVEDSSDFYIPSGKDRIFETEDDVICCKERCQTCKWFVPGGRPLYNENGEIGNDCHWAYGQCLGVGTKVCSQTPCKDSVKTSCGIKNKQESYICENPKNSNELIIGIVYKSSPGEKEDCEPTSCSKNEVVVEKGNEISYCENDISKGDPIPIWKDECEAQGKKFGISIIKGGFIIKTCSGRKICYCE